MSLAVQLQDTGNAISAVAAAFLLAELVMWWRGNPKPMMECAGWALFAIADGLYLIGDLMQARWGNAVIDLVLGAVFAWMAWRRWRKHRKAVAALLGAKSRALRDALVRRQRELTRPRPVPRLAPGGAR